MPPNPVRSVLSPTLPCADPRCDNMAERVRGTIRAPRYCAEHRHDIPGFANTERIDWWYLQSLSADATPTVLELTKEQGQCLVNDGSHAASDPFAWNLGRWLAQRAVAEAELPPGRSCEVMYGGD